MIASQERTVDAGALALELERLGGRLMMLFVAGGDGDGTASCARSSARVRR